MFSKFQSFLYRHPLLVAAYWVGIVLAVSFPGVWLPIRLIGLYSIGWLIGRRIGQLLVDRYIQKRLQPSEADRELAEDIVSRLVVSRFPTREAARAHVKYYEGTSVDARLVVNEDG